MGAILSLPHLSFMPRLKSFDEQQILEKAMQLFWKQGFSATSIQDLVSHLGINRASLYDTYGDKEKLFLRAFEYYRQTNTKRISQFFSRHSQVKEGFQRLFELAIDESLNDQDKKGCFVVNTTTELIPGDARILKLLEENRELFEAIFLDYLQEGETKGQFKPGMDLKAVAALLFTHYNGLKVVSKVSPNRQQLQNSIKALLRLLE